MTILEGVKSEHPIGRRNTTTDTGIDMHANEWRRK